MKKKGTGFLAVLLTLVLLLTGCQSIAEGLMSGAANLVSAKLDGMKPYPFCLDEQIQYGMSAAEVQAVLGAPVSNMNLTENEEFSMPAAILEYNWTFAEKESTLEFMFIGDNLCFSTLSIPCEDAERDQLVDAVKKLVEEAYGEMTGFRWIPVGLQIEDEKMLAQFSLTQGTSSLQGTITASAGEIEFTCTAQ